MIYKRCAARRISKYRKKQRINKKALKTDPKIAKATAKFEKSAEEYIDFLKGVSAKPDSKSKLAQIRKGLE